jgi:hypothetical protein
MNRIRGHFLVTLRNNVARHGNNVASAAIAATRQF